MFTGLKSVIYPTKDLAKDKKFWEGVTGIKPYFDQPFYVGFDINGNELGLDPNALKEGLTYPITYWKVESVVEASKQLLSSGVSENTKARDVGEGMMMATFKDPNGNIFGIIDKEKK